MAEMVYITELETGTRVALPLPPEAVKCKAEGKFISYNIINVGEIKLPNGEKLVKFSWSGRLPGESMRHMRIVSAADWRSPKEIQGIFSRWRNKGMKLRLLITGTTINHDVYLESYTVENKGFDTVEYSISFVVAKDIIIYTMTELNTANTTQKTTNPTTLDRAASAEAATTEKQTYTVKAGDCLWNIAKQFLGNGSRYDEIYQANQALIDGRNKGHRVSKYTIYAGQELVIPQ